MNETLQQEQANYQIGDVANGHVLGADGHWHALGAEATPSVDPKKKRKRVTGKRILIGAGAAVALLIAVNAIGGSPAEAPTAAPADTAVESVDTTGAAAAPADQESQVPAEYKNAQRAAENYLDTLAFSRSGLINQLEFEGYSTEAATWAVDSLNVDWNEQAVKKAEDYLDTTAFSRSGLIDQLEFEGFTTEQATAAVDSLNVDWNEQAVKKAQDYLDTMPFSRSELINQLEFEGFTTEQATYAADQVGL